MRNILRQPVQQHNKTMEPTSDGWRSSFPSGRKDLAPAPEQTVERARPTTTLETMATPPRRGGQREETLREQFERLILPHEGSLHGPAMALTRNTSDAEDLIQETLLRAYSHFGTFHGSGSARAWLHAILRNVFFSSYRRKSREPKQVSLEFFDPATRRLAGSGAGVASVVAPLQATVTSPERQVLAQMEGAAVLNAIRALPAPHRHVVVLADIHGLTYQEIADRMNIPVGTVRSVLSRGRERVRRAVFAWLPTSERGTKYLPKKPVPSRPNDAAEQI